MKENGAQVKNKIPNRPQVKYAVRIIDDEICIVFDSPVTVVNVSGNESIKLGRSLIKGGKRLKEMVRNKARLARQQQKRKPVLTEGPTKEPIKTPLNPALRPIASPPSGVPLEEQRPEPPPLPPVPPQNEMVSSGGEVREKPAPKRLSL